MYPILFSIGPYPVYSYGVCALLGALTLFGVASAQARRAGARSRLSRWRSARWSARSLARG
jgi:prolipoprotein diacylglyceryltransferase